MQPRLIVLSVLYALAEQRYGCLARDLQPQTHALYGLRLIV